MASHNSTMALTSMGADITETGEFRDLAFEYASLILKTYVNVALSFGGIVANVINFMVFYTMGVSDGITQNFLILSFFDGMVAATYMVNSISYTLFYSVFTAGDHISEILNNIFFATFIGQHYCLQVSYMTTTVTAVVRCCCVAMPLRVKRVMTVRRQLIIIALFSLNALIVNLIAALLGDTVPLIRPGDNLTQYSDFQDPMYLICDIMAHSLITVEYIIIVVCTIILIYSLYRSSKFREQSGSSSEAFEKRNANARETRVVQTILVITTVFIFCNIPYLTLTALRQLVPAVTATGHLWKLHTIILFVQEAGVLINANANCFGYFYFNTRYRNTLKNLFGKAVNVVKSDHI
ncbi:hypothetical protein EGW08_019605 [Elysia chlorotica]|uniref:G-protein coupled receptors family 1 profile domain-containing protein n=1 Tax=Elysia chlorotica TaxID=188477 RepID=A0A433STN7_ELYCH|nr:hypothetical protein EGW08_019605 [Elysia chlorotica]